jgi:hypothetical protein
MNKLRTVDKVPLTDSQKLVLEYMMSEPRALRPCEVGRYFVDGSKGGPWALGVLKGLEKRGLVTRIGGVYAVTDKQDSE